MTSSSDQRIRTPADLGLVIRERRRALGLDQRTLAARVGVSRQWLVGIEQGKPRAALGLVLRTMQALELEARVAVAGEQLDTAHATDAIQLDAFDIDAVVERARGKASLAGQPPSAPAKSPDRGVARAHAHKAERKDAKRTTSKRTRSDGRR